MQTTSINDAVDHMARSVNGLANELDAAAVLLAGAFGLKTPRMFYSSGTAGTIPAALDNLQTQLASVTTVCDQAAEKLHGLTKGRPVHHELNGHARPDALAATVSQSAGMRRTDGVLAAEAERYERSISAEDANPDGTIPDGTFADDLDPIREPQWIDPPADDAAAETCVVGGDGRLVPAADADESDLPSDDDVKQFLAEDAAEDAAAEPDPARDAWLDANANGIKAFVETTDSHGDDPTPAPDHPDAATFAAEVRSLAAEDNPPLAVEEPKKKPRPRSRKRK